MLPTCLADHLVNLIYFISFNIRSAPRNLEIFVADFLPLSVDAFGLSETRLTTDIESLCFLNGFDTCSCNRYTQGGGVQLYVRKMFPNEKVCKLIIMHIRLDCVFVRYMHNNKDYLGGQTYRPPGADLSDYMAKVANILHIISVDFKDSMVYLIGDFNINLMLISSNAKYFD